MASYGHKRHVVVALVCFCLVVSDDQPRNPGTTLGEAARAGTPDRSAPKAAMGIAGRFRHHQGQPPLDFNRRPRTGEAPIQGGSFSRAG